jgi:hypothetical protein
MADNYIQCYNILKNKYGLKCTLNCDCDTLKSEIKKIYLKYHPDKGGKHEDFVELRECAVVVIDKKCPKKYNMADLDQDCDRSKYFYRRAVKVGPKCVVNKKNPNYTSDKCPKGTYYRKGYEIPMKCIDDIIDIEDDLSREFAELKRENKFLKRSSKQNKILNTIFAATFPDRINLIYDDKPYKIVKIYKRPPGKDKFLDGIFSRIRDNRIILDMDEILDYYETHGYYLKYVPGNPCKKKTQEYNKDKQKCVEKKCIGGRKNLSKKTGKCLKPCKSPRKRSTINNRCKKL